MSASPDSFRRTRRYLGSGFGMALSGSRWTHDSSRERTSFDHCNVFAERLGTAGCRDDTAILPRHPEFVGIGPRAPGEKWAPVRTSAGLPTTNDYSESSAAAPLVTFTEAEACETRDLHVLANRRDALLEQFPRWSGRDL